MLRWWRRKRSRWFLFPPRGVFNAARSENLAARCATVTYTPIGSLQVTITPAGAVGAGAQWQVDGGGFQSSGATVSGLSAGSHPVGFKAITGWTTPGIQTVRVNANQATVTSTTYLTAIENWRQLYFGSGANSGPGADGADPDGDGLTNLFEFVAGLTPTDSASRFNQRIEAVPGIGG